MKSVMISIKPKWCELIASGKKTVEVRKTRPKIEIPFKCYIYCTKEKYKGKYLHTSNKPNRLFFWNNPNDTDINVMPDDYTYRAYTCKGKVIGEFVCDFVELITFQKEEDSIEFEDYVSEYLTNDACLTKRQAFEYSNGKPLYGWHISDLVIYDKPKEISEFYKSCTDPLSILSRM